MHICSGEYVACINRCGGQGILFRGKIYAREHKIPLWANKSYIRGCIVHTLILTCYLCVFDRSARQSNNGHDTSGPFMLDNRRRVVLRTLPSSTSTPLPSRRPLSSFCCCCYSCSLLLLGAYICCRLHQVLLEITYAYLGSGYLTIKMVIHELVRHHAPAE